MHTKKILAMLTLAGTTAAMAACADPTTSTSTADATTGATASMAAVVLARVSAARIFLVCMIMFLDIHDSFGIA